MHLKLLDLQALTLKLLLLVLHLRLLLLGCGLRVLHRVPDDVAGARAQRAANGRAGERMSDRCADQRTGAAAQHASAQSPFGGCGHSLGTASRDRDGDDE